MNLAVQTDIVRVKDRDALMQIVAAIIQKGHSEQYQDRIEAVLSVKSAGYTDRYLFFAIAITDSDEV